MNAERRRQAMQRVFLALWAMATFVLVFVIAILVYTMAEQGQNPLALAKKIRPAAPVERSAEPAPRQRTKEVRLYFAAPTGGYLTPETRSIEFSESTAANCRQALDALIQGPAAQDASAPILPSGAKVRGLYALENGELVVDFAQSSLSQQKAFSSATSEALWVYGVVNTVTQSALQGTGGPAIKAVRFLFEGFAPQEAFPAHLDLSTPITPDPAWSEAVGAAAPAPGAKGDQRG